MRMFQVTLYAKMAIPDSQRYPEKLSLIYYELCKQILFNKVFSTKVHCCESGIVIFAWRVTWNKIKDGSLYSLMVRLYSVVSLCIL